MTCTEHDTRRALIAALKDRVEVARGYVGLDSPGSHQERLRVLGFGLMSAEGRATEELKQLHAHALRLIEDVAHTQAVAS